MKQSKIKYFLLCLFLTILIVGLFEPFYFSSNTFKSIWRTSFNTEARIDIENRGTSSNNTIQILSPIKYEKPNWCKNDKGSCVVINEVVTTKWHTYKIKFQVIKDGKIEQIGTPVEVYEKPKSIYVADFLGEANIFKGIVKDDICVCEEANIKIISKFKNDTKVDLIVRPENVKLSKEKNSDLVGTIYEQIYDGAFTKILIKVNKKIIKAIISGNDKLYKRNDEVYLTWDIEDAIILESEDNEK